MTLCMTKATFIARDNVYERSRTIVRCLFPTNKKVPATMTLLERSSPAAGESFVRFRSTTSLHKDRSEITKKSVGEVTRHENRALLSDYDGR
jgi:hypothetical protein